MPPNAVVGARASEIIGRHLGSSGRLLTDATLALLTLAPETNPFLPCEAGKDIARHGEDMSGDSPTLITQPDTHLQDLPAMIKNGRASPASKVEFFAIEF